MTSMLQRTAPDPSATIGRGSGPPELHPVMPDPGLRGRLPPGGPRRVGRGDCTGPEPRAPRRGRAHRTPGRRSADTPAVPTRDDLARRPPSLVSRTRDAQSRRAAAAQDVLELPLA